MSQLYDARGNEYLGNLDQLGGITIADARPATQNIAALNGEVVTDISGHATFGVQITGTWVGTLSFEGTIDGTNYVALPVMLQTTQAFVTSLTTNASVLGNCAGFRRIRIRCSAYTSGTAIVAIRASNADYEVLAIPYPSTLYVTALGAANTAATLTITAGGAGLFHYINRIEIYRLNNSAAAIPGTAVLGITTTNMPGAVAWNVGNAIAAGGTEKDVVAEFSQPFKVSAANTASTIVTPAAGAGVQYRISVWYHLGA